jgi:hypothetical protein
MVREVRDFKNFVQNDFIHDIPQLSWDSINQFESPKTSSQVWKSLFLEKSKYFCEKIEHCTLSKNVKKSWS